MKTVIEMADEVFDRMLPDGHCREPYWTATEDELKRFVELVRADERWLSSQRRGVLMFNPYTGTPRHPSDVASDPHGILMLDPEQPIRAARSNT